MCPGLGARESLGGTGSLVVAPAGCRTMRVGAGGAQGGMRPQSSGLALVTN